MDEWDALKKTVKPLKNQRVKNECPKIFQRLRITVIPSRPVSYVLNLHGMSVSEAYHATCRFIEKHSQRGSKTVTIITGKGLKRVGQIKQEMPLWLETPFFQQKIRSFSWKNDGGAIDIILKKVKK